MPQHLTSQASQVHPRPFLIRHHRSNQTYLSVLDRSSGSLSCLASSQTLQKQPLPADPAFRNTPPSSGTNSSALPLLIQLTSIHRLDMAEPAYRKARADLLTAAHRVLHSPEILTQILHHLDKDTLARASSVFKFWYWECARHLWATCASLNPLMFNVPVRKHPKIAQLVHNLHLKEDEHDWPEGTFTSIPVFPCLRSLSVHALSLELLRYNIRLQLASSHYSSPFAYHRHTSPRLTHTHY